MRNTIILLLSCVIVLNISAAEKLVWPNPPAKPRIQFEQTIQKGKDLKIERGFFAKMFDFVFGNEEKALIKPFGVHVGVDERLYVTDTGAPAVFVFDKRNSEVKVILGAKEENFVSPIDVKTDNGNNIYVTDSMLKKIFVFDKDGEFLRYLGTDFSFERPTGLAINNVKEIIYVSDTIKSTIEVFTFDGKHIDTIGTYGQKEMQFNKPTLLAIDKDENVYVADSMNQRIQIFDTDGKFIRTFGQMGKVPGTFANPRGVAVDDDGNIYVSDTLFSSIQIFNNQGQLLMFFGQEGMGNGDFSLPAGISIQGEKIFISDSYNMRIEEFSMIKYKD